MCYRNSEFDYIDTNLPLSNGAPEIKVGKKLTTRVGEAVLLTMYLGGLGAQIRHSKLVDRGDVGACPVLLWTGGLGIMQLEVLL